MRINALRVLVPAILAPIIASGVYLSFVWSNSELISGLARAFYHGERLPPNIDMAVLLWQRAAELGDLDASAEAGRCYLFGIPRQDTSKAIQLIEPGLEADHKPCLRLMSYACLYGMGVPQDYGRGLSYLNRAIELNFNTNHLLETRDDLSIRSKLLFYLPSPLRDLRLARSDAAHLIRIGSEDSFPFLLMGCAASFGLDRDVDRREALYWLARASELGDRDGQFRLAVMLSHYPELANVSVPMIRSSGGVLIRHEPNSGKLGNEFTEVEFTKNSLELLEASAKQEHLMAQMVLALVRAEDRFRRAGDERYISLLSRLRERGFDRYVELLEKLSPPSMDSGHENLDGFFASLQSIQSEQLAEAELLKSLHARYIQYAKPDSGVYDEESLRMLETAFEKGSLNAGVLLAEILSGFEAGEPDYRKAREILSRCSEAGHPYATSHLGALLALGLGGVQDLSEAIALLSSQANKKESEADFLLGSFYTNGRGVPPSRRKAIELLESSSEKGCANAALELGSLYFEGDFPDVREDKALASKYFERAAALSLEAANYMRGRLFAQNNPVKAEAYFKLAAGRGHLLSRLSLARYYRRLGQLELSTRYYRLCLEDGSGSAADELYSLELKMATLELNKRAPSLVAASRDLPAGSILDSSSLKSVELSSSSDKSEKMRQNGAITVESILEGAKLEKAVVSGQVLVLDDIAPVAPARRRAFSGPEFINGRRLE